MADREVVSGEDVVEFRKRRKMSRKELAGVVGLTEGKIWRIENKGVIHDDERRALVLAGVGSVGAGEPAIPRQEAPASQPVALIAPHTPVVTVTEPVRRDDVPVDFAALSAMANTTYERYVSNSELQTFKRCRRKWWLSWHRGLTLIKESPVGVRQVGNRLHRALKSHYVPDGPQHPEHLLEALEREILLDRTDLGDDLSEEVRKKFEDEANLERIMLEGYLQWIAETGADSELEVIAPETYLEAGLDEFDNKVAIIGKLDVRVRRKSDDAHLFIDHKSVGDLRSPTMMLALDEQMLHYMLLEYLDADQARKESELRASSLARQTDVPGAQSTSSMGVLDVSESNHDRDALHRASQGRESREQRSSESDSGALGMPQQSSQQGRDGAPSSTQARGSEASSPELYDGTVGALYNMLRRVKRTARAMPPFYARVEVRHNKHELTNYRRRIVGEITDMMEVSSQLDSGASHQSVAYPRPHRDCLWDCPFLAVCPMFDDNSRVEDMLSQYFVKHDPLDYYLNEVIGANE